MRSTSCWVAALVLIAAFPLEGQTYADDQGTQCVIVQGLGFSQPSDCPSLGTPLITLTGSFEITPRGMSSLARVRCWVCEGGTCDSTSPYGPAIHEFRLNWEIGPLVADWTAQFHFNQAILDGQIAGPSLDAYYCQVELYSPGNPDDLSLPPMSWTVPTYTSTHLQARAEQGSQLMAVLQGPLSEPVEVRRRSGSE